MLKKGCKGMLIAVLIVAGWVGADKVLAAQPAERNLIVVASPSTYETGKEWVSFLQGETVPVKHVLPGDFDAYKKEQHIVVLGTPSEAGGAGEIITSLLTKDEKEWVAQQGNRRLYTKLDVWANDQTIFIFTAYSQDAITSAIRESKDTWWEPIMSWFDIEMEPSKLRGY